MCQQNTSDQVMIGEEPKRNINFHCVWEQVSEDITFHLLWCYRSIRDKAKQQIIQIIMNN